MPTKYARTGFADEWFTPALYLDPIYNALPLLGRTQFDLDVAAPIRDDQPVEAADYMTIERSGLLHDWHGVCWMNPPYSRKKQFVRRAAEQFANGNAEMVIGLFPPATDTNYWHEYVVGKAYGWYVRGRAPFIAGHPELQQGRMSSMGQALVIWADFRREDVQDFIEELRGSYDAMGAAFDRTVRVDSRRAGLIPRPGNHSVC